VSGVRHAFFTRRGGVSTGLFASLNTGAGSADEPTRVAENRRRAAETLGAPVDSLNTPYQVHSAEVLLADAAWGEARPRGDGVLTRRAGLICGVLAADCAPVLMADGEAVVVAAVHAGWRGALAGVLEAAVRQMVGLGAKPSRIVAAVGPCIGPRSYEVGAEFLGRFRLEAPGSEAFFAAAAAENKHLFNLPAFVQSRLRAAGVDQCEWLGRDTFAEEGEFFSNRRAVHRRQSDYGRLLSAIVIEDQKRQRLPNQRR
jgi:YfiH family protein